jgi:uncharacterized protein (DUF488 family)
VSHDLYTIGHSNHDIDTFVGLLKRHAISVLADVRSHPYSRRYPDYSGDSLRASLVASGISYLFMGKQLGARPRDPACYVRGVADFSLIRRTTEFREGMERLKRGQETYRICLMCAEREPAECHRAILVGQAAHEAGVRINHILADGALEAHEALLLRLAGGESANADLFGDEDRMALSLERQERRIAYRGDEAESE